ncbi:hypothetical protein [Nocardia crassostreae]|uniref:hypothetical protein n=1 Tax=Nocardia crassostreae TaxID=53428 RepID=UPI00082D608C|nr:hypothetical protein [Nocardia crassostreae]
MASSREDLKQIEIQVIQDVIDAAEVLLRQLEATGGANLAPRSQAYAIFIHAVLVSARTTGYYGPGSLAHAPLLDAILAGADATPWDTTLFDALLQRVVLD